MSLPARILDLRVPLAVAGAAVGLAAMAGLAPVYQSFPFVRPARWEDSPAFAAAAVFIGLTAMAAVAHAARSAAAPAAAGALSPEETAAAVRVAAPFRHATAAAALLLAVLIGAEGAAHAGPRNGFWATGVPRYESDPDPADGLPFWLEGQPLPADSRFYVRDYEILAGHPNELGRFLDLPGRAVYAFLVALVATYVGPPAGLYAAFVATNLACWWAGALATFDLARRATGSWWGGAVAGVLVATGIGFTFMAGGGTANAAAYGLMPVVLWLAERLAPFDPQSPWRRLLLHALLTTAASLTYSLLPLYAGFVLLAYLGRAPLVRLLVWCAITVAVSQLVAVAAHAIVPPALSPAAWPRALAVLAGALALFAGAAAVPARAVERVVAAALLLLGSLVAAAWAAGPARFLSLSEPLFGALQVPSYNLPKLASGLAGATGWRFDALAITQALHHGIVESHYPTAFPPPVWLFAAAGFVTLPPRWRAWAAAQLVTMTVFAGASQVVGAGVHPRLSFLVYPAVYVLAAQGLLASAAVLPPPFRAAVCAAALLALAYPGNASLLGNQFYGLRFHGLAP